MCALSLTRKQTHVHTHTQTHTSRLTGIDLIAQDSHLSLPSLSLSVSLCFHLSILKYQEVYEPLKSKLYYPLLDLLDMLVLGNLFSLVLPLSVSLCLPLTPSISEGLTRWGGSLAYILHSTLLFVSQIPFILFLLPVSHNVDSHIQSNALRKIMTNNENIHLMK